MGFTAGTASGSASWAGRVNDEPVTITQERSCLYGYSEVLIVEHAGLTERVNNQGRMDEILAEERLSLTLKVG